VLTPQKKREQIFFLTWCMNTKPNKNPEQKLVHFSTTLPLSNLSFQFPFIVGIYICPLKVFSRSGIVFWEWNERKCSQLRLGKISIFHPLPLPFFFLLTFAPRKFELFTGLIPDCFFHHLFCITFYLC